MRWSRILAAGGLAAVLLLPGAAVAEDERHVGLHDMACTGITAMGEGMPRGATLRLTLVDQDNGATLAQRTVRASAMGMFETRLPAQLNQVLGVRLLVSRTDGSRVGFADHVMAKGAAMCNLPFTGPARAAPLLALGAGSLALGLALILAGSARDRRGRGRWVDARR
jgi:hypothetical protein